MKRVCMVLPSFTAKGGITAVVNGYKGSLLESAYEIKYIETYTDGNKMAKLCKAISAYWKYICLLLTWHPELIHVHASFGASFYRKRLFINTAYRAGIPIINHIHGADFEDFFLKASDRRKKQIENCYHKCSKLIVLSDEWKETLKVVVSEEKLFVVENYGILNEEAVRMRKNKENANTVLFLGFICKRKGCYDIPAVAEKVVEAVPGARFVIAGSGEIEKMKTITSSEIQKNIVYAGWVRNTEKDKYLRQADVFFLPSYNEGMPMSILDAMSYGLPVVSTTVGGIPKIVQNGINGYCCAPGDTEQMAKCITNLLLNEKMRAEASAASADRIRSKYSLEAHLKKLMKVYNAVLT